MQRRGSYKGKATSGSLSASGGLGANRFIIISLAHLRSDNNAR
ncbi:hypothetical protein VPHD456G2_0014 [Vibrio phage D456 g2]